MKKETWFVYEISEGSFREWYYWGVDEGGNKPPARREIGHFAKAINILARLHPDEDWYDQAHEYWTTTLPGAGPLILVRPRTNPFAPGYLIARVQFPWLTKEDRVEI